MALWASKPHESCRSLINVFGTNEYRALAMDFHMINRIALRRWSGPFYERSRLALPQQIFQIEPLCEHRQRAVRVARPLLAGPVPIQFDAVLVGVAQVERLADAVVAGAVERNAGGDNAMQGIGER